MKVIGIVAEYNPFHNGHAYHIEQTRLTTGADYVIAVISGNFVQRGAPAIFDKFTRAKMALQGGVDLVLELPSHFACSSAPDFAQGAIDLLDSLGVVGYLSFGSECGNLSLLEQIACITMEETGLFSSTLREYLQQGFSYPKAFATAFTLSNPEEQQLSKVIAEPNNLLGIEYLKALKRRKSSIIPTTILRNGSNYHDTHFTSPLCSALAIRSTLANATQLNCSVDELSNYMPMESYDVCQEAYCSETSVVSNDFSNLLLYQLRLHQQTGYTSFYDVPEGLSNRIIKYLPQFTTIDDFCNLLKTKDYTFARISRCLLHILLNIKQDHMIDYTKDSYAHYARILGFSQDKVALLHQIKQSTKIPIITKLADAHKHLEPLSLQMLEETILHSELYHLPLQNKNKKNPYNEYQANIVRIPSS